MEFGQITHLNNLIKRITPVVKTLSHDNNNMLINDKQPPNGTLYQVLYGCTSITLPDTSDWNDEGFKITIFNLSGDNLSINLYDSFSNNTVLFNGISYDSNNFFRLTNRNIVEMIWKRSGWIVTNSNGFSL